jgi:hypothetical protein
MAPIVAAAVVAEDIHATPVAAQRYVRLPDRVRSFGGNRKIVRNPNFKRRFDFSSTVMRPQQSSLICLLQADLKREEKRT